MQLYPTNPTSQVLPDKNGVEEECVLRRQCSGVIDLEVNVNLVKHSSVSKYQSVFTQRVREMIHYFHPNLVDLA